MAGVKLTPKIKDVGKFECNRRVKPFPCNLRQKFTREFSLF